MPTVTNPVLVRVRSFSGRNDTPAAAAIDEAAGAPWSAVWSAADFKATIGRPNTVAYAADLRGLLAGYLVYELLPREYRLLNLAVAPWCRRRRVATQLVRLVCARVWTPILKRPAVTALVCERNLEAQLFLRNLGFRAVAISRDRYGEDSDGILFAYRPVQDDGRILRFDRGDMP